MFSRTRVNYTPSKLWGGGGGGGGGRDARGRGVCGVYCFHVCSSITFWSFGDGVGLSKHCLLTLIVFSLDSLHKMSNFAF